MSYEEELADLKIEFGKRAHLSPSDIADYIGRSPDAQAAMRYRKTFPIPYQKFGGKIFIRTKDFARYLAGEYDVEVKIAPVIAPAPQKRQ